MGAMNSPDKVWHTLSLTDTYEALRASEAGLTQAIAAERLQAYGPNRLPEQKPLKWWRIFIRQFHSPLIYILAIAASISFFIGEHIDAIFIALVLLINSALGSFQEWKAEQNSRALQKILQLRASVLRDGEISDIAAADIVPGDIVFLESGNRAPADIRLISSHSLEVDESMLSGESLSVTKEPDWEGEADSPLADQKNMCFAGSTIVRGRAKGLVIATATQTAVGQLALDVLQTEGGKPPLILRMERFSRAIAMLVLLAACLIGVIGVFLRGFTVSEMFLFGVALAVSAIPEGLPVALTVALSIATTRMARRGVIVRRLPAVEGLGSCTFIASDKTGTITCNELTVRKIHTADGLDFTVTGEGFHPNGKIQHQGVTATKDAFPVLTALLKSSLLCNEAALYQRAGDWVWRGDPTDIAILSAGYKFELDRQTLIKDYDQIHEIPFESENKFSATFLRSKGIISAFVKGAPETILNLCSADESDIARWIKTAEDMARKGYRVLAIAEKTLPAETGPSALPYSPKDLTFLGFIGMIDPLRPEVVDSVQSCFAAGITVSMVTGDHPVTALAIAKDLGLTQNAEEVISGAELEHKSLEELCSAIKKYKVFARVAPHQKLELVRAARHAGHFVAVTGDGVNDAPALREANIGVAMGRAGTDIAREASELVISDDNFSTIVAGIEEGRIAYDNVRKVIYLLISTGFAEVTLVGLAMASGLPLPLLPVQLLWLNLVTNGIQDVALACEPGEGDALKKPPRSPLEPIFNRLMIERTLVASTVMGLTGFAVFAWLLKHGYSDAYARNALLLLMVLFENVHIGNCRSETKSAFLLSPLRSPILLTGTVCAAGLHIAAIYSPIGQTVLKTMPVSPSLWGSLTLIALTLLIFMELHKWNWHARHKS